MFPLVLLLSCITAERAPAPSPRAPAPASSEPSDDADERPNVLLIIADDLGVDALSAYPHSDAPPPTPTLEGLAARGLALDRFWVTPACTTTRAALLTGQHGITSGVRHVPAPLPADIPTIAAAVGAHGYHTAAFGKWHLGGGRPDADHPRRFGFDHFAGNLANVGDYFAWDLTVNGHTQKETAYHTTKITDLAIEHLQGIEAPWFVWMAYSAPHAPFQPPPPGLAADHGRRPADQYRAMVEAMDHEIGRLIAAVPADTYVLFVGDNGTPRRARDADVFAGDHVKGSVYEGGIRTPLLVAGPDIPAGRRADGLAHAVDLYATVLGLVGIASPSPRHSRDLSDWFRGGDGSPRERNYTEFVDKGAESWAVSDGQRKVIVHPDGRVERFSAHDLAETQPLPDSPEARALLEAGRTLREGPEAACVALVGERSHATTGSTGSHRGTVSVRVDGDRCVIEANGVPDHGFGDPARPFPHDLAPVPTTYRFPLDPRVAAAPTPLGLHSDDGVLLNGVPIDVLAAACFGVGDGKTGCGDPATPWRYDPVHPANTFRLDARHAHTQRDGGYHYHGPQPSLGAPGIIGFAADGFPIRSAWVGSGDERHALRSSYRLRTGEREPLPGAAAHPGGAYDGTYRDDWVYVEGSGDLDVCNGKRFDDGYAYVATEAFPYFPACFVGRPDPSFRKGGRDQGPASKQGKRGKGKGKVGKGKRRE